MVSIARAHCLPELSEEVPARSVPLVVVVWYSSLGSSSAAELMVVVSNRGSLIDGAGSEELGISRCA